MKEYELIETLSKLTQLNIDTMYAYDHALDQIEDEIILARLTEFRDMHRKHVENLSEVIHSLGGKPPKITTDFKGFVIEAFTALLGFTGMKGSLKALKTIEKIAKQYYGEVVSKDIPSDLKEILGKHFTDERIHLNYIKNNLSALMKIPD